MKKLHNKNKALQREVNALVCWAAPSTPLYPHLTRFIEPTHTSPFGSRRFWFSEHTAPATAEPPCHRSPQGQILLAPKEDLRLKCRLPWIYGKALWRGWRGGGRTRGPSSGGCRQENPLLMHIKPRAATWLTRRAVPHSGSRSPPEARFPSARRGRALQSWSSTAATPSLLECLQLFFVRCRHSQTNANTSPSFALRSCTYISSRYQNVKCNIFFLIFVSIYPSIHLFIYLSIHLYLNLNNLNLNLTFLSYLTAPNLTLPTLSYLILLHLSIFLSIHLSI